eukprot:gnl/TRDRNA2_/TRDRNA2_90892_c0_seq1.p1 gnl/TRDRNA2_/TRDRNA2_90892_c0~~gnl/TRDRNA2_/TRDRNA2_90892_c0_seq1.p1  ORF type:complete len:339 (+),score=55.21 gnl/TRDRNA2_/TRDRNA2_90892_c0_seq1:74-1090(+)
MDFDDLEEAVGNRPGPYESIYYFPKIQRSYRLPGRKDLPEKIQSGLPDEVDRSVLIRAFAFYGAGDIVVAWADLECKVPIYAELATHEWPSHGVREDEACPATLDDLATDAIKALMPSLEEHAKGGRLEGAPFVFIGHSIGNKVMSWVARRIWDDMGLEPVAVFAMDSAPPHMPLFSEYGQQQMKEDGVDFMRRYNSQIYNTAQLAKGERGQKMLDMWLKDLVFSVDTREVGFHKFNCPVHVMRALRNWHFDLVKASKDATPEALKAHADRDALMWSSKGSAADCDMDHYKEWQEWTTGECTIHDVDTDHMGVRNHPDTWALIWKVCDELKAPKPSNA